MRIIIQILVFTFIISILPVCANPDNAEFYFSKIKDRNGELQTNIKAIIQDHWGFMWFGTKNKLNRYDGINIKTFDCYDKLKKKRNNNISTLFEDEKQHLWVGTDKGIFIFNPSSESFSFFDDSTATGIKIEEWIADIQAGTDDNIWIVVPNQGLFRYHTINRTLHFYELGISPTPNHGNPQSILIEKNGKVWIGTNGNGLFLYDKHSDSFTQFLGNQHDDTLEGEHIFTMCDYGDEIIIGIHEGKLQKFNKLKNTLENFDIPEIQNKIIRHIVRFDNDIWAGTESGLFVINEINRTLIHLEKDPIRPYALSDNRIEKIYKDRENGIWIATNAGGVNYLPQRAIQFEQFIPLYDQKSISSSQIRELRESPAGNIWIATEDAGVNIFNPATKEFRQIRNFTNPEFPVLGIHIRKDEAWIGHFKNGLDIIEIPSLEKKHYSGKQLGLNESSVSAILEDRHGNTWIGNMWGMFFAPEGSKNFKNIEEFGLNLIFDIFEDSDGFIWAATIGNGAYMYNPKTKETLHFPHNENDSLSISSNSVSSITEDSKGNLWFSTDRGGICKYNKTSQVFDSFSTQHGLPDDVSYKILEDKNGYLWFGTNKGLVKFHPNSKNIRVFTTNDGLIGDQFGYKSALKTTSGQFYFGGFNGLISFNPEEYTENKSIPPVFITGLKIHNKDMNVESANSPLKQSIIHTQKIQLTHDQSNLSFEFIALSYNAPSANKYAYMMEGIDYDWIYPTDNHSASYIKLPPGKYSFKVKGSNNDGIWNNQTTEIEIEILPPWWHSSIAYFIYMLLFCIMAYLLLMGYKRKIKRQQHEKLRILQSEKEKEIYNAKLDFFTEIAHEIRTPLTLINGPLEKLLALKDKDTVVRKNLEIIDRNTSQLLNLINRLLDFRKIQSSDKVLKFSVSDISEILKELVLQFDSMIKDKNKSVKLTLPDEAILASVDKNELHTILNNLMVNAIKYADQYIEIELKSCPGYFIIIIKNDGELIPKQFHQKIFEPFYRINKKNLQAGSGVGLSLVQSLVKLHGGDIHLETDTGFNSFIMQLPINQNNSADSLKSINKDTDFVCNNDLHKTHQTLKTILVVDDHAEMLSFISDLLSDHFMVEKANSGLEALELLKTKPVELILTDVMMPEMDGVELCTQLKSDIAFSHIPVVLLTAKNDLPGKIRGLEAGAEAYVEKPFSPDFLIAQLNSILENRNREREAFMKKPFIPLKQLSISKSDEQFMDNIIKTINDNIADPEFNIDQLVDSVFMSRSNMHRKIKTITGLAPNEFVRLIRLKKAAEIISKGEYQINEVGYLVGINSPSYFTKLFHKQFGITPKEFEKKQFR